MRTPSSQAPPRSPALADSGGILPDVTAAIGSVQLRRLPGFIERRRAVDELYDAAFVRPAKRLGLGLWQGGDVYVIDGFGPDGIAAVTSDLARRTRHLQTGYVYHYAFAMLIGLVIIITAYLVYWGR